MQPTVCTVCSTDEQHRVSASRQPLSVLWLAALLVISAFVMAPHTQALTFEADRWDLAEVPVGQTAKVTLKVRNSSPYELHVRYLDVDPPFIFNDKGRPTSRISNFTLDQFSDEAGFEVTITPGEAGRFCSLFTISYFKCPFDNWCFNEKHWEKAGPICATAVSYKESAQALLVLQLLLD